jgi:hypothetical protein
MQEWLNNLYRDTQSNRDGRVEGRGLGAAFLQNFVDEDKLNQSAQRSANQRTAASKGENLADLNLGSDALTTDVEGAVITRQRERSEETKEKDHRRGLEPLTLQLQQQGKQSDRQHTATMTQLSNQNAIAMAGLTQSNNQFAAQMADNKDQRAMELQIRREELDRVDARDARNRRRDSIAALTSGLAALGAAFAL